jgi:segregation and condensation protein B
MPFSDEELRNRVEALLFSVGKKIDIAEIAKLVRYRDTDAVESVLRQIKEDYEKRDSPMMVANDGTSWKIVVREKYNPVVKKVVADVELSRTLMETLALVAWKNPVRQSEIVAIRSNKAYDHLDELERMGFITRKKYGRTKLISLTEKFFNYFELSGHDDIREAFRKIKQIEEQKMQEYAAKRAERDMRKKHAEEVRIINEKAFLDKIDRQLEREMKGEEKNEQPALEAEITDESGEGAAAEVEKKAGEAAAEEEKGEEEESKDEDYDKKLDEEGMPNLDENRKDEEEKKVEGGKGEKNYSRK